MTEQPDAARIDRNWTELLQELRVAQTGVQILAAFLLTVPFSSRFEDLATSRQLVFIGVLLSAVVSMFLLLTPVALHRQLFRRGQRLFLVESANRLARVGLVFFVVAVVGAVWVIVDLVVGAAAAWAVAGVLVALPVVLWTVVPWSVLRDD